MPHLLPSQARRSRRASSNAEPAAVGASSLKATLTDLFDRTTLLRCTLMSLASLAVGLLLMRLWLPTLSDGFISGILARHLPTETARPLVWLRLCGARLPILLLLAVAGLTRISGGLTTAILVFRGLCDGAAIALATSVLQGTTAFPNREVSPAVFLVALCAWVLLDAAVRTLLAAEARRFARETAFALLPATDPDACAQLRYRLWRYATFVSAALVFTLLFSAGYLLLLRI